MLLLLFFASDALSFGQKNKNDVPQADGTPVPDSRAGQRVREQQARVQQAAAESSPQQHLQPQEQCREHAALRQPVNSLQPRASYFFYYSLLSAFFFKEITFCLPSWNLRAKGLNNMRKDFWIRLVARFSISDSFKVSWLL